MSSVDYVGATRQFPGADLPAVNALELSIGDGEFMVLVGPSGSGKSTALRMLAGLEPIDAGKILIGGEDVSDVAPKDRDIAMVFQNYALYPQMTVEENIGFSLKVAHLPKEVVRERTRTTAELLGLGTYLDRKPASLSGGQRQRVAMGRAIVREPRVFLMDEPLSNLDAQLRVATRTEISSLQRRLGVTTVYVTHDQVEAMTMGDRVAVLRDGLLQQCDVPRVLYEKPNNVFVAGFIGSPAMNLFEVALDADGAHLGPLVLPLPTAVRTRLSDRVVLGIRPGGFELGAKDTGIGAVVDLVEELGEEAFVYTSLELEGAPLTLVVRTGPDSVPARGERVGLLPRRDQVHLFDPGSGARLEP